MNREQLITRVKSVIYQNDNNEIDAQKHQDLEIEIINTLLDAVGSVSSGFISTIQANAPAPTPQKNGYYIFSTAGTIPYISGSPTVKVGDWLVVTYVGLNHTYNNVGKLLNLSDSFTISDSNIGASLKALYDGLQDLSTRLKNGSNLTIKDLENGQATANNRLDGLDLSVKNIGRWCNIVANESASNARLRVVPALRRRGFQLERLGTDSVFVTEKYIGATFDDSEWSKDSNWIELETKNNKNKAGGYVGLDSSTLIQDNQIPNTVERVSKKNQPNGYAGIDSNGFIPISIMPRDTLEQLYAYGIERDITVSSTACTRIGNLDMHRTLPIQNLMRGCLLDDDGNVVKYLNPTDWTSEVRDGSQGQVMVEMPEPYMCFRMVGNKMQVLISQIPIPGYTKASKMFNSAYEASLMRSTLKLSSVVNADVDYRGGANQTVWDGTYRSLLGRPVTNLSRTQMRTYARNRNSNTTEWNIYAYSAHLLVYWLYVIEYANLNSQLPYNPAKDANGYSQGGLGNGVTTLASADWNTWNGTYPFVACGHTDALGNGTGEIPYTLLNSDGSTLATVQVPRYRGIENPFGHIWKWLDGINVDIKTDADGGTSTAYRCDNPDKFVDNGYGYYRNIGLMARSEGYIREIIFGDGGDVLAKTVGGGSSSYFADYNYTSVTTSSLRSVLVGGNANSSAGAGLSYAYSSNAPSATVAYIGSRLCFLPRTLIF